MEVKATLILDDDPAHRSLIRRFLSRILPEHVVYEADSIATARELITLHNQDLRLILLDLNLRGEQGTDILPLIKVNPTIKTLILSTSNLESDISRGYAAGADAYCTKSVDPTTFLTELEAAIRSIV